MNAQERQQEFEERRKNLTRSCGTTTAEASAPKKKQSFFDLGIDIRKDEIITDPKRVREAYIFGIKQVVENFRQDHLGTLKEEDRETERFTMDDPRVPEDVRQISEINDMIERLDSDDKAYEFYRLATSGRPEGEDTLVLFQDAQKSLPQMPFSGYNTADGYFPGINDELSWAHPARRLFIWLSAFSFPRVAPLVLAMMMLIIMVTKTDGPFLALVSVSCLFSVVALAGILCGLAAFVALIVGFQEPIVFLRVTSRNAPPGAAIFLKFHELCIKAVHSYRCLFTVPIIATALLLPASKELYGHWGPSVFFTVLGVYVGLNVFTLVLTLFVRASVFPMLQNEEITLEAEYAYDPAAEVIEYSSLEMPVTIERKITLMNGFMNFRRAMYRYLCVVRHRVAEQAAAQQSLQRV